MLLTETTTEIDEFQNVDYKAHFNLTNTTLSLPIISHLFVEYDKYERKKTMSEIWNWMFDLRLLC